MPSQDIDAVLLASNHYEALGIFPEEARDSAKLRKAYLRRSVQVHPDKNGDDSRAAQAFQRVTLAYTVLSNDETRSQYERDGGGGGGGDRNNNNASSSSSSNETYYAHEGGTNTSSAPPSYRDALFVFATVASMMSGKGKRTADMAQALNFAETFLRNDKSIRLSDGPSKAQAAMGAGAAMRVVSSAARAAGFKKSANAIDSAASLVQVAGIGAMVADTPAVKRSLDAARSALAGGNKKAPDQATESASSSSSSQSTTNQYQAQQNRSAGSTTNSTDTTGNQGDAQQPTTENSDPGLGGVFAAVMSFMSTLNDSQSATNSTGSNHTGESSARGATGYSGVNSATGTSANYNEYAQNSAQGNNNNSSSSNNNNNNSSNNTSKDDMDEYITKAKAVGMTTSSLRRSAEAARKSGFIKQAADLEYAAQMAEMTGKAANLAESNPMVKSALKTPMFKRMMEEVLKQGTATATKRM